MEQNGNALPAMVPIGAVLTSIMAEKMPLKAETCATLEKSSVAALNEELKRNFEAQYGTDTKITPMFLTDLKIARRKEQACLKCTGAKCLRDNEFVQNLLSVKKVCVQFGELRLVNVPCKYAEMIRGRRRMAKQFGSSQIPARYIGKTFDAYEITAGNDTAYKWARYMTENPISLFISGSPGVGKTLLAAIVAQTIILQGSTVIFGDVPSLLDRLKETFSDKTSTSLDELMKSLSRCDLLVLDDLGTEKPTEWALERLYMIINNRYTANKRVLVTSNYKLDELLRRFGDNVTGQRIISRLREMCKVSRITGEDYRNKR